MQEIPVDSELVAYCGLYCGACSRYLKGACPGCKQYSKGAWCRVRSCCIYSEYSSCAECRDFADPAGCRKYSTLLAKLIGFLFKSDRRACILHIRRHGLEQFTRHMAANRLIAFPLQKK